MSLIQRAVLDRKHWARWLRVTQRALYWALPPLLLYLVFSRVDFERLGRLVSSANLKLLLAGASMVVLVVATGALRWYFLLRRYGCASFHFAFSLREYWKSLAIGIVVPGSLGSDAYRVMAVGRKGKYLRNAFVIAVEKFAALLSCAVLILVLSPLLMLNPLPVAAAHMIDALFMLSIAGAALAIFIVLVLRQRCAAIFADACDAAVAAIARRIPSLSFMQETEEERPKGGSVALMLSVFSPAVAVPVLTLSLAIQFIAAAQAQLYFLSLGYDVPFIVNVLVTQLLVVLLTLPISFGGIGVREGAYVLLYGAFGVPPETALAASFFSLLSASLCYAIGACIFLFGKYFERSG